MIGAAPARRTEVSNDTSVMNTTEPFHTAHKLDATEYRSLDAIPLPRRLACATRSTQRRRCFGAWSRRLSPRGWSIHSATTHQGKSTRRRVDSAPYPQLDAASAQLLLHQRPAGGDGRQSRKLLAVQRRPADQATVDVGLSDEVADVLGIHRAAVEHSH